MRIVAITGNHPRHNYLVRQLHIAGVLVGWVQEEREEFVPQPPVDLSERTAVIFREHFRKRADAEEKHFGCIQPVEIRTLLISRAELNSTDTVRFLQVLRPDLVLSYGCHKLSLQLREAVAATFWNTHGGLSPEYRGVTTHFWPSFMLEPQMTGMTLHETTNDLDGGAIIHQSGAALYKGDGLHDLAARTVKKYADEIGLLLNKLDSANLPTGIVQRSVGKLWTSQDWRPEHLHAIYETWQDRIVDALLEGKISGREPTLASVLKIN